MRPARANLVSSCHPPSLSTGKTTELDRRNEPRRSAMRMLSSTGILCPRAKRQYLFAANRVHQARLGNRPRCEITFALELGAAVT